MKVYVLLCESYNDFDARPYKTEIIGVFRNRDTAVAKGRELCHKDLEELEYGTVYFCKGYELQ